MIHIDLVCCDLLKIHYLCGNKDNMSRSNARYQML